MKNYLQDKKQILKPMLLLAALVCFGATVSAQQWGTWCYKDFPANGTFTVPEGCTKVYFEAIGGGGAGGFVKGGHGQEFDTEADNENMYQVSGGGGGGAYGLQTSILALPLAKRSLSLSAPAVITLPTELPRH